MAVAEDSGRGTPMATLEVITAGEATALLATGLGRERQKGR